MIAQVVSITPSTLPHHRVTAGAERKFVTVVDFATKKYFALKVGEEGRGRKQRFIPLLNIACPPDASPHGEAVRKLVVQVVLLRQGRAGWLGEAVEVGEAPVGTLVLLDTGGGFRGDTGLPKILGDAKPIEIGWYAQGQAGRAGRHPALMILATGPARIEWHRAGRLYGAPANWVAWTHDGITWYCVPREDYLIACDMGIVPDLVMSLGQGEGQGDGQA